MKKIIVLILLAITLFSCNSSQDLSDKMTRLGAETNKFLEAWKDNPETIRRYNAEIDKIRQEAKNWGDTEFDAKLSDGLLDAAWTLGITDRKRANKLFKYVKDVIVADKLLQRTNNKKQKDE
jgi:hypothetical protein